MMKSGKGILPEKSKLDARVRGDSLGVNADWRSLEALAEATRTRCEEDPSEAAKLRYLGVIEAMLPVLGGEDAERFRKRHHALVAVLAPDSLVDRALAEVPSLGPEPELCERLAEELKLDDYKAPEEDADHELPWVEPDEPRAASSAPRVPSNSVAA